MDKIKVLQLVPGLASGGISSVLLNYYKHMDREKVHFDFAVFIPELGINAEAFKQMGSEIYILPQKSKGMREYKRQLMKIIREGKYDVVHAHENYQSFISLGYAKKCGVSARVAHAHATMIDRSNLIKKLLFLMSRFRNKSAITDYFACGSDAGRAMFGNAMNGKNAKVLKNAIFVENFVFSPEKREQVRQKMNWEGKLVISNIGRFALQKNQLFLIDVFFEITRLCENAILCICGEGPEKDKIVSRIKEKNLEDKVQLLGARNDVPELMNAFDVFVLPSLFEGLPVVGIEALTNGLPCVMSDTITREFDEYNKVKFLSIESSPAEWAKVVVEVARQGHDADMAAKMRKSGYDIVDAAKSFEQFYMDKVFGSGK